MITQALKLSQIDIKKLLGAASPDAALLHLYLACGNRLETAEAELNLSPSRLSCAAATLRHLGLLVDDRPSHIAPGERPSYSETDVLEAMDTDNSFRSLYGEVQRQSPFSQLPPAAENHGFRMEFPKLNPCCSLSKNLP